MLADNSMAISGLKFFAMHFLMNLESGIELGKPLILYDTEYALYFKVEAVV